MKHDMPEQRIGVERVGRWREIDRSIFSGVIALSMITMLGGCQVLPPVPIPDSKQFVATALIDEDESQIEIGRPNPLIDSLGWVVGIPAKITLWDRRVDNHQVSAETMLVMADYLEANNLPHIKVRANQYAPIEDWHRLRNNTTVAWPWRYTIGAISVAGEAILPGRIFGGDHFNPYTQSIHLYSDVPAIALHEGAHAKDFARRQYQGTYAALYAFWPLWHETLASQDVFAYLQQHPDQQLTVEANRILYPAYGTYVGSSLGSWFPSQAMPLYFGGVLAGHLNGHLLNRNLPYDPTFGAESEYPMMTVSRPADSKNSPDRDHH